MTISGFRLFKFYNTNWKENKITGKDKSKYAKIQEKALGAILRHLMAYTFIEIGLQLNDT